MSDEKKDEGKKVAEPVKFVSKHARLVVKLKSERHVTNAMSGLRERVPGLKVTFKPDDTLPRWTNARSQNNKSFGSYTTSDPVIIKALESATTYGTEFFRVDDPRWTEPVQERIRQLQEQLDLQKSALLSPSHGPRVRAGMAASA